MSAAPKVEPDNRLAPVRSGRGKRSMTTGDAPEALLDRYLTERGPLGRTTHFYRDHREAEPRFVDAGRSLRAPNAYPDAVRDILKIAQHRGWDQLRVSGEPAFRREVWVQAQTLGLEVQGHRPSDRDRQAADPASVRDRSPRVETPSRLERAAVVVRALIEDQSVQARLLANAFARANARQPDRDRNSERDR